MTEQLDDSAMAKAWALVEANRPEQALAELARLSPDQANHAGSFRLRGHALAQLSRWPEVQSNAQRGLALSGPDPILLGQLGSALGETGDYPRAERALLDALALEPNDVDLLCEYSRLCLKVNQPEKAKALWERAAAQRPHSRNVLATRVLIAIAFADDRQAQKASEEFLGAYPSDPAALALHGQVAQMRGRSGYGSMRQAVAASPADADIADMAWQARVYAHPLMMPLRPLHRFGPVKTWLCAIALIFGLRAIGLPVLSALAGLSWLAICVYSWVVPPLVRKWVLRRRF